MIKMDQKFPWCKIEVDYESSSYKVIALMMDDFIGAFKKDCGELGIRVKENDLKTMEGLLKKISRLSYLKRNEVDDLNCGGYVTAVKNIMDRYIQSAKQIELINQPILNHHKNYS